MAEIKTTGTGITERKKRDYDVRDHNDMLEAQRRMEKFRNFSQRMGEIETISLSILRTPGCHMT